jgi:hypothetical protein
MNLLCILVDFFTKMFFKVSQFGFYNILKILLVEYWGHQIGCLIINGISIHLQLYKSQTTKVFLVFKNYNVVHLMVDSSIAIH